MKYISKFCALLTILTFVSIGGFAQEQDKNTPPKDKTPKVKVQPKSPPDSEKKENKKPE